MSERNKIPSDSMKKMKKLQNPANQRKEVREKRVYSIRAQGAAYDPIRLLNGRFGWMKYEKGQQSIIASDCVTIGDTKHVLSFPKLDQDSLTLPTGQGKLQHPNMLIGQIRKLADEMFQFPTEADSRFFSAYVFSTWTFDLYDEVMNMAFVGPAGAGMNKALNIAQSLAYNAYRGSGGDTDAALIRIKHMVRGSTVLDEVEKADNHAGTTFHKLLALENQRSGTITKNSPVGKDGWEPQTFNIYGPNVVATAAVSDHPAIRSRTFWRPSRNLRQRSMRQDDAHDPQGGARRLDFQRSARPATTRTGMT